jgi:hypothetical protein
MKMEEYFPFNLKNGYKSDARAHAHTHTHTRYSSDGTAGATGYVICDITCLYVGTGL